MMETSDADDEGWLLYHGFLVWRMPCHRDHLS